MYRKNKDLFLEDMYINKKTSKIVIAILEEFGIFYKIKKAKNKKYIVITYYMCCRAIDCYCLYCKIDNCISQALMKFYNMEDKHGKR